MSRYPGWLGPHVHVALQEEFRSYWDRHAALSFTRPRLARNQLLKRLVALKMLTARQQELTIAVQADKAAEGIDLNPTIGHLVELEQDIANDLEFVEQLQREDRAQTRSYDDAQMMARSEEERLKRAE